MHVTEKVNVLNGNITFAFVYNRNRIEAIALEINSLGHRIENVGLIVLEHEWYALPDFTHDDWVQFNRIVDEAQQQLNFVDIKERLMAAHYERFEAAVNEEESWIGVQRQRTDSARADMKRAIETGSTESFFKVIENFFRKFRR